MKRDGQQNGMRLHDAIIMAARAHQGQHRKGTDLDYLVHPMEVLEILASMNADSNLRIAGVLHDTIEDAGIAREEIFDRFGEDVARLVEQHSEDKTKSWEERKRQNIAGIHADDLRHQMLVLADGLSNLRSMAADYRIEGEQLWTRFRAPKERQKWYYGAMKDALFRMGEEEQTEQAYLEWEVLYRDVFAEDSQR